MKIACVKRRPNEYTLWKFLFSYVVSLWAAGLIKELNLCKWKQYSLVHVDLAYGFIAYAQKQLDLL